MPTISKAPSSNKPPPPHPEPPAELFTAKFIPSYDRTIWISVPQPDHLTIIIPIIPKVYGNGVPDISVEAFANGLGEYFQEQPHNAHWLGGKVWWNEAKKEKAWKDARLALGTRQATVHFELLKAKAYGHRLRIDLNPRKLGPKGFAQLALVLGGENAPFDLAASLAEAWVSRVDIAIDLVGIGVAEVVARHKKQGKRVLFTSADGALQSIYINRKKLT